MSLIALLMVVVFITSLSSAIAKDKCKRHGHKWGARRNRLKCTRCGHKQNQVTVVNPKRGAQLK